MSCLLPPSYVSERKENAETRARAFRADLTGLDAIFLAAGYSLPTTLTVVSPCYRRFYGRRTVMEFMRELDNTQWWNTNVAIEEVAVGLALSLHSSAIEGLNIITVI